MIRRSDRKYNRQLAIIRIFAPHFDGLVKPCSLSNTGDKTHNNQPKHFAV